MNELDSLRQEAETLKNAIRVSIFAEWFQPKETHRIEISKFISD